MAKAAFMRAEQDNIMSYAKQKGYNLTPEERDFFTTASYNGGSGNGQKMLDYYGSKKELGNNAFLKDRMSDKGQIYDNVLPRYAGAKLFNNEGYFKMGGEMKYPDGGEIDPLTGKPKPQELKANLNSVFADSGEGFPSRDQQPGDLLTISEIGDKAQAPQSIVPLSQFYNTALDSHGNKVLQGTGQYVNALGGINPGAEQQAAADKISQENLANANQRYQTKQDVEKYAALGITAINEYFNKKEASQQSRTANRRAVLQGTPTNINPFLQGNGSQAIMKDGGEISGDHMGLETLDGGKAKVISTSDHSNPMIQFDGREHKDGGIGISYGGQVAEVEDKEVGFIDKEGGLNIFGKLKVPGTNMTFRKMAQDVAMTEAKVDGQKSKYLKILNEGDHTDPYQESAISTAKVMFKSLDNKSKEIAEKKEAMADYQNLMLSMMEKQDKMANGGYIPKFAGGGKLDPNDPKSVQAIIDKYSGGKSPLKAEDFIEVSKKYNVPLDLMLAQAIQESNIGTKGMATRTHNIFNVGNNGNTGKTTDHGDYKAGLENYAKLIASDYAKDGKVDVNLLLSTNFQRPKKGGNYAEEKDYAQNVARLMNEINPGNNYSAGSSNVASTDPYPKNFKGFVSKDHKTYKAPDGLNPAVFYKDPDIVKALKDDKTFPKAADDAVWGIEHDKLWNSLSQEKKDALLKKSGAANTNTPVTNTGSTTNVSPDAITAITGIPQGNKEQAGLKDTPYGKAHYDAPALSGAALNMGNGEVKRGNLSPLALEQIAPELLTMATNRRDPVEQDRYQPNLKQTFDVSYQEGRNSNQATFNQMAKILENNGNTDALSILAAQKYNADAQYNNQEIQGNAQQKLAVYNQNTDTLNDAQLRNIALIGDQQTKQAQAKYNTRKEDLGAFASISGKVLQNELENKTYNAYANLFKHYGFDKNGNVTFNPDNVTQKFTPGEAQHFGMLAARNGLQSLAGSAEKTVTKTDKDGNVKSTTYTNDDLNEFNSIMENKNVSDAAKQKLLRGNKYGERYFSNQ
jgi:flagellum-specific peptidoglycan hydrolase FlgJ